MLVWEHSSRGGQDSELDGLWDIRILHILKAIEIRMVLCQKDIVDLPVKQSTSTNRLIAERRVYDARICMMIVETND